MQYWLPTLALLALALPSGRAAPQDEPGRTPYMGWSSWSLQATTFPGYGGGDNWQRWLTAERVKAQSDAMHAKLQSHGYAYINIDSGWKGGWDAYGRPLPDAQRFPQGIVGVARHVHANGQKLGIYTNPGIPDDLYALNPPILGTRDHIQDIVFKPQRSATGWKTGHKIDFSRPSAQAYINSVAALFASWGVDFLKFDGVTPGSDLHDEAGLAIDARPDVAAWGRALKRAGRPVWLELSWDVDGKYTDDWAPYASGRRVSDDVEIYGPTLTAWRAVRLRFDGLRNPVERPGGGKYWSDLDSADVGCGAMDGLTPDERQTTVTLWAISGAPLYTGDDLTKLDAQGLRLLTNDEVIAVDRAAQPGVIVAAGDHPIRCAPNADGSVMVALFNVEDKGATVTAKWVDLGIRGPARARDLWSHRDLGTSNGSVSADLPPHGSRLLRIVPRRAEKPQWVRIVNAASGRLLSVRGGSLSDAAPLVVSRKGGDSALWRVMPSADGCVALVNKKSGQLVNIPGPTEQPGAQLIQYYDDGKANSRWRLTPTENGLVAIVSRHDGQAVDVQGGSVVQSPRGDGLTQQWRLAP